MTSHPQPLAQSNSAALERAWWPIQLHTLRGALLAVVLLRVAFGLLALPISAAFPDTPLEQRVGLLPGEAPLGEWLERVTLSPWQRYDAWNYERIADHGYHADEGTAAFHPLYPMLAAPLSWLLGGNVLLALLLVSTAATVALCVVFTRYVQHFHPEVAANRAGWLLLIAPPAFIMLAPYNEALFMALAVGCIWAARERRWWLAGLFGALATLTRQHGLALMAPLAYAIFEEGKRQKAKGKSDFADAEERSATLSARTAQLLLPFAFLLLPLGYAAFVAYRAFALGDLAALGRADTPFAFLRALLVSRSSEHVVPGQRVTWPWVGLFDQIGLLVHTADYALAIDLLLGLALVAVIAFGLRRMHATERLYSLGLVALALCYYNGFANPLLSLPRHLLIAFPLFVVLARWLGRQSPSAFVHVRPRPQQSSGTQSPSAFVRVRPRPQQSSGVWARRALLGLFLLNVFLAGAFIRHGWVP